MCGIAAVASLDGAAARHMKPVLGRVRHRGLVRCQNEVWQDEGNNVALGVNRLPIESTMTRRQPRVSADQRWAVAYNGEVYNWRSLRRTDNTSIDETQSLVEHLACAGVAALSSWDGMFAIVAYDITSRTLHLARDPLGIKPLYYAISTHYLSVASELKALAWDPHVHEVHELAPGELRAITVADSFRSAAPHRYWHYPEARPEPVGVLKLRDALVDVVTQCARTSNTLAVHLSGGLDSSGVAAIALQERRDLVLITAGKPSAPDVRAAQEFGTHFKCDVVSAVVPDEDELFERVLGIVEICESFEPNVVRQSSAYYSLARASREAGAQVVLCGEGADELFGGYPEFVDCPASAFDARRRSFLADLYRTQLQRVDRVSMHFTIETRVPFLRSAIVTSALMSSHLASFVRSADGLEGTKLCLRQALEGILPDRWRIRPKVVLSEGMGLGGNDPLYGMFARLASRVISARDFDDIRHAFPEWGIRTREEAFYFREFERRGYTKLLQARKRVAANSINSRKAVD